MSEFNNGFLEKFKFDSSNFQVMQIPRVPDYSAIVDNVIPTVEIDEKGSFANKLQKQTKEMIKKSNEQIRLLSEQNERLESNYKKLEQLYNLKDKELKEVKSSQKRAKVYNTVTMIVAIISMIVAIAAWLLPNMFSGATKWSSI